MDLKQSMKNLSHADGKDYLAWATFLLILLIATWFVWETFRPYEPIRVDAVIVSPKVLHRGEKAMFQFQGEKYMPIPVHATIELVDGSRHHLMSYTSNNPVGCSFKPRDFVVPYSIIPGKWRLKWSGVYEVNMVRSITKTAYSEEIEIK